ncbi:4'-phosphopantetheinyl transferase superfamily [Thalictrum thalictroides]|uniref:holo-[acyl-carrier-protein] synthase n=1 Tax=Thalictrum thalictroides TaxID=46969 RepID=A0A7J6WEK3_THATH|nr:4'-phosphopantetheinyl transferase superfamily [Thalictrum thalictroides]
MFCSSFHLIPAVVPSQRELHFWYVVPDEVKDASLLTEYLNLLSPCEKENVLSIRGEYLQKRALLARTLVRTTLAKYTNPLINPSLLKFRKNTFGKPEVEWQCDKSWDPPALHFNISHTSSLIACGVTVDMPIGIDVEEKQRKTNNSLSSLAQRYFSLHEIEYLHGLSDPEIQRQEFIKLWTLKEAYVKALGRGFSAAPFKTFTIRFRSNSRSSFIMSGDSNSKASEIVVEPLDDSKHLTTNWKFTLFELANSHYAATCVENNILEGEEVNAPKLKVWKTLPLVKDEFVSETDSVRAIAGFT